MPERREREICTSVHPSCGGRCKEYMQGAHLTVAQTSALLRPIKAQLSGSFVRSLPDRTLAEFKRAKQDLHLGL